MARKTSRTQENGGPVLAEVGSAGFFVWGQGETVPVLGIGALGLDLPPQRKSALRRLRVAVIDGDAEERALSRTMIEEQCEDWSVSEYESATWAIATLPAANPWPHVVLTEIATPRSFDVSHIGKLKALMPDVPLVVLTRMKTAAAIRSSLGAGAFGYLTKPIEPEQLAAAVADAVEGQPPLCPEAEQLAVALFHGAAALGQAKGLTEREAQVTACMVAGLSDKQIGQRLGISHQTAHVHLVKAFGKLGGHSREAVAWKLLFGE